MIKAIIFDMDGVIVDSEPCALENRLAYLRQVGIEADDRKLAGLLGRNMADVWRIIAPSKMLCNFKQVMWPTNRPIRFRMQRL